MKVKQRDKHFIIDNWKWFVIFIMLGVIMYWTAYVIQPTIDILETQNELIEIEHNQTQGAIYLATEIMSNVTEMQTKLDILLNITDRGR